MENNLLDTYNHLKDKFVILHLDEKFIDIKDIETKFENSITSFQKNINKKVILTTFNNNLRLDSIVNRIKKF